ncbi:MAG: hypothetical protein H6599_09360 [Flavobacteriales bacterium]|nr:hypothetical protein [Flavobacteriales bacterium]
MLRKFQKYYFFITSIILFSCNNELNDNIIDSEIECMNCNDIFLDPMYNHFYTDDRSVPFSGMCRSYNSKGDIVLEKHFVDGKQDGVHLEFYEDGTLKSEWHFSKGRQHGDLRGFNIDGSLQYHAIYYKGDLDSTVYP